MVTGMTLTTVPGVQGQQTDTAGLTWYGRVGIFANIACMSDQTLHIISYAYYVAEYIHILPVCLHRAEHSTAHTSTARHHAHHTLIFHYTLLLSTVTCQTDSGQLPKSLFNIELTRGMQGKEYTKCDGDCG